MSVDEPAEPLGHTPMPELWRPLPLVFVGALVVGWIRIKAESIVGPRLVHSTLNVELCLYVASKTVP